MSKNRIPEIKHPNERLETRTVVEYFHPREHAILAEYFELKEKLPKEAQEINPFLIVSSDDDYDEAENGITCRTGRGDRGEHSALSNAVARIALAPIRTSLPTWGTYGNTGVFHTRQNENKGGLPLRGFRSDPILVLSINWADSGPGYSWPVHYYISWIPVYDQYVVTASYDSDDVEGYLDVAIGSLSEGAEIETDLKQVIKSHWDRDSMYLHGWSECLNDGIVKDPWAWRDEIAWGIDENGNDINYSDEDEEEDEE